MATIRLTTYSLALSALPLLAACSERSSESLVPAEGSAGTAQESTAPAGATPKLKMPKRGETPAMTAAKVPGGEQSTAPAAPTAATPAPIVTAPPKFVPPTELSRFADPNQISDEDLGKYHVTFRCSVDGEDVGTMTFAMWTGLAPITTRNFLRLCDEGFYDGLTYHRILREFMVQGGDPTGTGGGNGPYGTIQGEMSNDAERAHGYGVLSMARMGNDLNSASTQFFLCCDESPSVWGLDGKYASFGRLTSGVATLEKIASVPTRAVRSREASTPLKTVTIDSAKVIEGPAPTGEAIARPEDGLDLGGEARKIVVQHVLISFDGCNIPGVTRTKEEAEALAREIVAKVEAGEDMDKLAREYSDDPVAAADQTPGCYTLLNTGVRDRAGDRRALKLQQELQAEFAEKSAAFQGQLTEKALTQEEFNANMQALQQDLQMRMMDAVANPRDKMVPAFGDIGFSLQPGAVGLATHDATTSPFGYHVIRRLE
ncbi:peptidylprolyl isomerase [bacterium]|nr:peptidylprolyl isomerase [Planctomycetota bacterium]MDB4538693.1 peptidylprolyl isomerase [bacterium]